MRHYPDADPAELTPDQRRIEVASILARGVLRLQKNQDTGDCLGQPRIQLGGGAGTKTFSSESRPTSGSGPTGISETSKMGVSFATGLPITGTKTGPHPASWQALIQISGSPPLYAQRPFMGLVVEHEDVVLEMISDILAALGHHLVAVGSVEQARLAVGSEDFSYVISSITARCRAGAKMTSCLNGQALLRELNRGRPELPVIMMGHPDEYTPGMALGLKAMGAADIVVKPFPGRHIEYERPLSVAIEIALKEREQTEGCHSSSIDVEVEASEHPLPSDESVRESELSHFEHGTLEFFPSSIKLCDRVILSNTGLGHGMRILDHLSEKSGDRFVRITGEGLAKQIREELKSPGIDISTITGAVRHIRSNIKKRMLKEFGLVVDTMDVIVRDNQGYHLNDEKVTVVKYESDEPNPPIVTDEGGAKKDVPSMADVPSNVRSNVPPTSDVRSNVLPIARSSETSLNERQTWILSQVRKGGKVTRSAVEEVFGVCAKTAGIDLRKLKQMGLIMFVRRPHPGYYRLKE